MPEVRQREQTVIFFTEPFGWTARTFLRFGFQRLLVTLWAWLMLLPNIGFLPQISQTFAIVQYRKGMLSIKNNYDSMIRRFGNNFFRRSPVIPGKTR